LTATRQRSRLLIGIRTFCLVGSLVAGSACGFLSAPSTPADPTAQPSPTLLPPPKPFSSPEAGPALSPAASPSPVAAAPKPTVPPTPIPPPNPNPGAASGGSGERATVVNTDNQGANMRSEPSPTGALVRTIKEGSELEVIGAEREGGGRRWRNVRDPASGSTGWIVADLLAPMASSAPAAEAKPAGEPKPSAASSPAAAARPAGEARPGGEPKPAGEPKPSSSPAAGDPSIAAKPATRIGDDDRAYLSALQPQVDALGKAISAANEQIERAGGRPDTVNDPAWQKDTQAVVASLNDAAKQIRAASPGPATGEVNKYARNAADRADEAASGLNTAIDSHDARALNGVRTTLVRLLAEINNMNLTLLNLQ
jgi:uncharacterized protein YgiM (DUF1202 family)